MFTMFDILYTVSPAFFFFLFMRTHLIFYIHFIIMIRHISTISCQYRVFLQMFYSFIYVHVYPNIALHIYYSLFRPRFVLYIHTMCTFIYILVYYCIWTQISNKFDRFKNVHAFETMNVSGVIILQAYTAVGIQFITVNSNFVEQNNTRYT